MAFWERNYLRLLLAVLVSALTYQALVLPGRVERLAKEESRQTREAVIGELHPIAASLAALPESLVMEVDDQVGQLSGKLDRQITQLQTSANARITQALTLADGRIGQAIAEASGQITELRGGLGPAFTDVAAITQRVRLVADANLECRGNGACWPSGVTAALGGAKVALGETAQAMRRIDAAMPQIIETAEKIGANSDLATAKAAAASEETRKLMSNLAEATRPLPRWLRYPLGIAGVAAPVASGAIGAAAAMGAFR